MGAGRKTNTFHLKEKGATSWTTNCSAPARNLRKSDLGAVIFGCKHNTINECHTELLFGLPAPHYAYVKNIRPGMSLFLFNYSDRRLHGIYEATSQGQLNINPYGWTADHADYTPYAAQVRIKVRMQCLPLSEDEFKPLIAENYYEPKLFWFELDRAQSHKLIFLFTSRTSVSRPLNMAIRNTAFPTSIGAPRSDAVAQVSHTAFAPLDNTNVGWEGSWEAFGSVETETFGLHPKPAFGCSYSAIVSGTDTSLPEKKSNPFTERKWSSLFESSITNGTTKKDEESVPIVSDVNFHGSSMEWASSSDVPFQSGEKESFEAHNFEWASENYEVESQSFEAHNSEWASGNHDAEWKVPAFDTSSKAPIGADEERNSNLAWLCDDEECGNPSDVTLPACHISCEAPTPTPTSSDKGQDSDLPCSDRSDDDGGWSSASETIPSPVEDGQAESFADEDETEAYEETLHTEANTECSYSSAQVEIDNDRVESIDPSSMEVGVRLGDKCSSKIVATVGMASPDVQALVLKLIEEVEALKVSHQIIGSLERELVESKAEIELLKTRYQALESRLLPSTEDVEEAMTESCNEPHIVINDPILIVGGFDGNSWLPDLCSYLPFEDILRPLAPMSVVRGYSSAVSMNGEVYVLGGADGNRWYDTVESYNPLTDQWSSRPPLNQKKGSLTGASLLDKIFAIGGGDGKDCLSNVDMLDLNIGKWIPARSMVHKRFAPAAAELNGAIYVVGGYNGKSYLSSAERFDPREHSWKSLRSMGTKRGCHSLTVLNDKLYVLGGYNGAEIVSSVEIFDPRMSSWMIGESMNSPRGYCGATVNGEKIHVIGGITENDVIHDTIELYEEGRGWEMTDLKAVGKRCFFSAVVP